MSVSKRKRLTERRRRAIESAAAMGSVAEARQAIRDLLVEIDALNEDLAWTKRRWEQTKGTVRGLNHRLIEGGQAGGTSWREAGGLQ